MASNLFFNYPRILGHELGVEVVAVGHSTKKCEAGRPLFGRTLPYTVPRITHRASFADAVTEFPRWTQPETGVIKAMIEA
jgi:hypothetical protein